MKYAVYSGLTQKGTKVGVIHEFPHARVRFSVTSCV